MGPPSTSGTAAPMARHPPPNKDQHRFRSRGRPRASPAQGTAPETATPDLPRIRTRKSSPPKEACSADIRMPFPIAAPRFAPGPHAPAEMPARRGFGKRRTALPVHGRLRARLRFDRQKALSNVATGRAFLSINVSYENAKVTCVNHYQKTARDNRRVARWHAKVPRCPCAAGSGNPPVPLRTLARSPPRRHQAGFGQDPPGLGIR